MLHYFFPKKKWHDLKCMKTQHSNHRQKTRKFLSQPVTVQHKPLIAFKCLLGLNPRMSF